MLFRSKEALGCPQEARECFERASVGPDEPAGMMYYYDQPADMILYQGLAKLKLGRTGEAKSRFYRLIDYGEQHIGDHMRIEYFAVSLPDFLIFEDDLDVRNKAHCCYLMGFPIHLHPSTRLSRRRTYPEEASIDVDKRQIRYRTRSGYWKRTD